MTVSPTSLGETAVPADESQRSAGQLAAGSPPRPAAFLRTAQYIDCADAGMTITETAKATGASISAVKTFAWRYPEIKFKGQYGPRKVCA